MQNLAIVQQFRTIMTTTTIEAPEAPTYSRADLDEFISRRDGLTQQLVAAQQQLDSAIAALNTDPMADPSDVPRFQELVARLQTDLAELPPIISEAEAQLETDEAKQYRADAIAKHQALTAELEEAKAAEAKAEKALKTCLQKLKVNLPGLMATRYERRLVETKLGQAIAMDARAFFRPIKLPDLETRRDSDSLIIEIASSVWTPEKPAELSIAELRDMQEAGAELRAFIESTEKTEGEIS